MIKKFLLVLGILVLLVSVSCKKNRITYDPAVKLTFSTDTLSFDTVFTQMGSATRRFVVYNRDVQTVVISSIQLVGGENSNFRLNVNGQSGIAFSNIELRGKDSMFVFVDVTVDPNNENNPFVIFDHVRFKTNGNTQEVVLSAWGQNAYYYRPNLFIEGLPPISHISDYTDYFPIGSVINLPNDKPHVIFGFLMIDSAVTLNIPPGTKLHFYDKAGMWAYRGSVLNVNGSNDNEVVFSGTRLEDYFDDKPGQWDRIIVNEGPANHVFSNVIIQNSFIGIQAEEFYLDGDPQLASNIVKLHNTIIQNCSGLGLLVRNHNLIAENVLVANAGNVLVGLQGAGSHFFRHTTFANFWRFGSRSDETLLMSNYFGIPAAGGGQVEVVGDFTATFSNCVIYGTNEEELHTDSIEGAQFKYIFENCILRTEKDTHSIGLQGKFKNVIINPSTPVGSTYNNPLFIDPYKDNFLLHDSSRAINQGSILLTDTLLNDLKGDLRDNQPDLGCYEW